MTAVIELAVFRHPHRRPLRIMAALLESQEIPTTQEVFRRTLRLKHEPDAIWYSQVFWPVPSGTIELEVNPLVCTSARRFGEVQKNTLEQLLANRI
jgi:hypothetical protein